MSARERHSTATPKQAPTMAPVNAPPSVVLVVLLSLLLLPPPPVAASGGACGYAHTPPLPKLCCKLLFSTAKKKVGVEAASAAACAALLAPPPPPTMYRVSSVGAAPPPKPASSPRLLALNIIFPVLASAALVRFRVHSWHMRRIAAVRAHSIASTAAGVSWPVALSREAAGIPAIKTDSS